MQQTVAATAGGDFIRQLGAATLASELDVVRLEAALLITTGVGATQAILGVLMNAEGVEVSASIANWETSLSVESREAMATLLVSAHDRLRFVRFGLTDQFASAVSFATADRLDIELPDSVAAVTAAAGLLWREVRSLANDGVARTYLEMTQRNANSCRV